MCVCVSDHWKVCVCSLTLLRAWHYSESWRGLLWGHTPTHSHSSSSRHREVSGSVSLFFEGCEETGRVRLGEASQRLDVGLWGEEGRGRSGGCRRGGRHWHRYEGRKGLGERRGFGESLFKVDELLFIWSQWEHLWLEVDTNTKLRINQAGLLISPAVSYALSNLDFSSLFHTSSGFTQLGDIYVLETKCSSKHRTPSEPQPL